MSETVYILLDIVHADPAGVARELRKIPGISAADVLEGPPDIHVAIEARDKQKAAAALMTLLDKVDGNIADIRILPVRDSGPEVVNRQPVMASPLGG